jgi:type I restriction-modification system DNA methylase subunit
MLDIEKAKKTIKKLIEKFDTINDADYDKQKTFDELIKPLFKELGWDFQEDVTKPQSISGNKADYAFKINNVSRFYLSIIPPSKSINDLDIIQSLTTFTFNKGVTWAILTNFKELRVYNVEAPGTTPASMQHHTFSSSEYITKFEDMLDLTKHQFSLNVLDSDAELFGKKPKRISVDQQLLKDLLRYRDILMDDVAQHNSIDEEQIEKNVPKILNRLIFIRSCGDRKIEERYLISSLNEWEENKNKKLIEYLHETFAYFRGRYGSSLFEKHECDHLKISDETLQEIISGLYKSKTRSIRYDFSLISSDILGKMYENYLGIIQRKKDGVYYTPNHISNYICNNTIIPYLSKSDITNIPDLISEYSDNIEELETKLHNIKILDPACGTGEFLIRSIDVLINIGKKIQDFKSKNGKYEYTVKKKKSGSATFQTFDKDIENQKLRTIIRNNIHGVDINYEAIEITQLNLFLKLSTSSQQLMDVSKNIRVGNSIIDDRNVDVKAFVWEKEFPKKFDVIIGNPPYVRQEEIKHYKKNIEKQYKIFVSTADLYTYFYELGIKLLKDKGVLGLISSNKFMRAKYGSKLREFLKCNTKIMQIIDFGDKHLFNAITNTVILITSKKFEKNNKFLFSDNLENLNITKIEQNTLNEDAWTLASKQILTIKNKMEEKGEILKNWDVEINRGLLSGLNEAYVIDTKTKEELCGEDSKNIDLIKPIIRGRDINRYSYKWNGQWIIFIPWHFPLQNDSSVTKSSRKAEKEFEIKFPAVFNHLKKFKEKLENRNKEETGIRYEWYALQRYASAYYQNFSKEKIIWIELTSNNRFAFSPKEEFVLAGAFLMTGKSLKYLLAFLNSKVCKFYFKLICNSSGMGTVQWKKFAMERIPIPKLNEKKQKIFEKYVEQILLITKNQEILKVDSIQIEEIEEKIDHLFYKEYNFTQEDILIIES